MTVKDAMKLKRGDRVGLTRDERTWKVAHVHLLSARDVEVVVRVEKHELRLRGAAALRSLKELKP